MSVVLCGTSLSQPSDRKDDEESLLFQSSTGKAIPSLGDKKTTTSQLIFSLRVA